MTEQTQRTIEEKTRQTYRETKRELECWKAKAFNLSLALERTARVLQCEAPIVKD